MTTRRGAHAARGARRAGGRAPRGLPSLFALGAALVACGGAPLPDPREATRAYADALARGDADAVHAMMTEKSRLGTPRDEVARLLAAERAELVETGRRLTAPDARVEATARMRYDDGEGATLVLEKGAFRIAAADALPVLAKTPTEALEQMRRVLARRSYAGLLRVLSPATRAALESDLRSLVLGLSRPEGLLVKVQGDAATVEVPGGHLVKLRREGGVWHVEDFD